jgi:glycosyltransferase involved in cell wall biosynthesis
MTRDQPHIGVNGHQQNQRFAEQPTMLSNCRRVGVAIEDRLRYDRRVRGGLAMWNAWRARGNDAQSIARLCAAARLTNNADVEARLQARIAAAADQFDCAAFDWRAIVADFNNGQIGRAAILKPHLGAREKGVIFIAFEIEWIKLLAARNLSDFAERYDVVIAPSSSPHNLINYAFPRAYPGTIFTLISNAHDLTVLPRVSTQLTVVPLYASHWVNPDAYAPLPHSQRPYDLIMVANWGKVKRHHALFRALREMPSDIRLALVGQSQDGRTPDDVRRLASWYGVANRFTLFGDQSFRCVARLLCESRASVVLSRREGSCVVVAESMFANTPVALLEGAVIGSRAFINDQTGRFLDERQLSRDLCDFVRAADDYKPRAWAEQNISCTASSNALNEVLKGHARRKGDVWTQDIAQLQWSPNPTLSCRDDQRRMAAERAKIVRRYGLEIGAPPEPAASG